jgi:UDP-N-acetylmuramoyl-L-alanyl-D-glutamate--2,6-diaminopimelate ligase
MLSLTENLLKLESIKITGFTDNSNFVEPNYAFISFSKNPKEALKYSKDAIDKGAIIVISQVNLYEQLKDKNLFDSNLANHKDKYLETLFARSKKSIKLVGITGTNGKSSTTFFLHQLLSFKDSKATLLTNLPEVSNLKNTQFTPLTTPDNFLLHHFLKKSIDLKRKYFLMEVSSHGIEQRRISGLDFFAKSLTSFSKDHLDYHKNFRSYRNAKKSFFSTSDENTIVSIDNDLGREIHSENKSTLGVSVNDKTANLYLENNLIKTPWGDLENHLPFKSKFMISNFLCALGLYGKIFNELDFEAEMLKNLKNLPGRLQKIPLFQNKNCYVDYAHTPDALKSVLDYLRSSYKGKIITLFGCGGERDSSKRGDMGKIAQERSDFQIITNDNPRNEDPKKIVDQIIKEMHLKNFDIIFDRKEAISEGLKKLKKLEPESVLLIAGKGHENFQIIKGEEIEFNDTKILNELKDVI